MLKVMQISKWYKTQHGDVKGAKDMSFEVPSGKLFTLLGPSGCGKTTTLRCIAGLEQADEGEIWMDDHCLFSSKRGINIPPYRRRLGMVFQSYALWPHMDVFQNVAYPLQNAGVPKQDIQGMVENALKLVGLQDYLKRHVSELSGGQQQRVAVARAVVGNVQLLLLDEPLSNLDAKVRVQVRKELKDLQSRLGLTAVYVTHDQEEAMAISDYVAVVNEGAVVEWGPPQQLYQRPRKQFTASFLGDTNFVEGVCLGVDGNGDRSRMGVRVPFGTLMFPPETDRPQPRRDERVLLSIRPENIRIVKDEAPTGGNVIHGRLIRSVFLGPYVECEAEVKGHTLLFRAHPLEVVEEGQSVVLQILPEGCSVVEPSKDPQA